MLGFFSIALLYSCNKDSGEESFTQSDYEHTSIRTEYEHVLSDVDSVDYSDIIPTIEEIEIVKNYIEFRDVIYNDVEDTYQYLGQPKWNHAIIKREIDPGDRFIVSIPLYHNDILNGFIKYVSLEEKLVLEIHTKGDIYDIIHETYEDEEYLEKHKPHLIVDYYIFDILEDETLDPMFEELSEVERVAEITTRCRTECISIYEEVLYSIPTGYNEYIYNYFNLVSVECFLVDCYGNSNSTFINSGSGSGSDDNSGDGITRESTGVDELDILKDCLESKDEGEVKLYQDMMDALPVYPGVCTQDLADEMRAAALIDKPCDDIDLIALATDIAQANEDKKDELEGAYEFYKLESDAFDPCSGKDAAALVEEAKKNAKADGLCGLDGFEEAFSNLDWITTVNLTDKRLKCIFKSLLEGSDNVWCNTIENFIGDTKMTLNIQSTDQITEIAQVTYYNENTHYPYTVDMSINPNQISDYCEVAIVGVFLHEAIHAEMKRQLNDPSLQNSTFADIWLKWEVDHGDHENMADSYISDMIEALKKRFGNRYTDLEYEAIAWNGLGLKGEEEHTPGWLALSTSKQDDLKTAFDNLKNNCGDDECKK